MNIISEHNKMRFEVEDVTYEVIYNFRDAFNKDIFLEKFIDVLKDKQFIVGDLSGDKLRLKGFILTKDNNSPNNINNLQDYILEYCNFGCPFFVLEKKK